MGSVIPATFEKRVVARKLGCLADTGAEGNKLTELVEPKIASMIFGLELISPPPPPPRLCLVSLGYPT